MEPTTIYSIKTQLVEKAGNGTYFRNLEHDFEDIKSKIPLGETPEKLATWFRQLVVDEGDHKKIFSTEERPCLIFVYRIPLLEWQQSRFNFGKRAHFDSNGLMTKFTSKSLNLNIATVAKCIKEEEEADMDVFEEIESAPEPISRDSSPLSFTFSESALDVPSTSKSLLIEEAPKRPTFQSEQSKTGLRSDHKSPEPIPREPSPLPSTSAESALDRPLSSKSSSIETTLERPTIRSEHHAIEQLSDFVNSIQPTTSSHQYSPSSFQLPPNKAKKRKIAVDREISLVTSAVRRRASNNGDSEKENADASEDSSGDGIDSTLEESSDASENEFESYVFSKYDIDAPPNSIETVNGECFVTVFNTAEPDSNDHPTESTNRPVEEQHADIPFSDSPYQSQNDTLETSCSTEIIHALQSEQLPIRPTEEDRNVPSTSLEISSCKAGILKAYQDFLEVVPKQSMNVLDFSLKRCQPMPKLLEAKVLRTQGSLEELEPICSNSTTSSSSSFEHSRSTSEMSLSSQRKEDQVEPKPKHVSARWILTNLLLHITSWNLEATSGVKERLKVAITNIDQTSDLHISIEEFVDILEPNIRLILKVESAVSPSYNAIKREKLVLPFHLILTGLNDIFTDCPPLACLLAKMHRLSKQLEDSNERVFFQDAEIAFQPLIRSLSPNVSLVK